MTRQRLVCLDDIEHLVTVSDTTHFFPTLYRFHATTSDTTTSDTTTSNMHDYYRVPQLGHVLVRMGYIHINPSLDTPTLMHGTRNALHQLQVSAHSTLYASPYLIHHYINTRDTSDEDGMAIDLVPIDQSCVVDLDQVIVDVSSSITQPYHSLIPPTSVLHHHLHQHLFLFDDSHCASAFIHLLDGSIVHIRLRLTDYCIRYLHTAQQQLQQQQQFIGRITSVTALFVHTQQPSSQHAMPSSLILDCYAPQTTHLLSLIPLPTTTTTTTTTTSLHHPNDRQLWYAIIHGPSRSGKSTFLAHFCSLHSLSLHTLHLTHIQYTQTRGSTSMESVLRREVRRCIRSGSVLVLDGFDAYWRQMGVFSRGVDGTDEQGGSRDGDERRVDVMGLVNFLRWFHEYVRDSGFQCIGLVAIITTSDTTPTTTPTTSSRTEVSSRGLEKGVVSESQDVRPPRFLQHMLDQEHWIGLGTLTATQRMLVFRALASSTSTPTASSSSVSTELEALPSSQQQRLLKHLEKLNARLDALNMLPADVEAFWAQLHLHLLHRSLSHHPVSSSTANQPDSKSVQDGDEEEGGLEGILESVLREVVKCGMVSMYRVNEYRGSTATSSSIGHVDVPDDLGSGSDSNWELSAWLYENWVPRDLRHFLQPTLHSVVDTSTSVDSIVSALNLTPAAILMYGPPGTSKSHLARYIALQKLRVPVLSVSMADLLKKEVGESERHLERVFAWCQHYVRPITVHDDNRGDIQPGNRFGCCLVLDEFDALLSGSKRGESSLARTGNDVMRRLLSCFISQLDHLSWVQTSTKHSVKSRVLILGITNLPWSLDESLVMRPNRFEVEFYVGLIGECPQFMMSSAVDDTDKMRQLLKCVLKRRDGGVEQSVVEWICSDTEMRNRIKQWNVADLCSFVSRAGYRALRRQLDRLHAFKASQADEASSLESRLESLSITNVDQNGVLLEDFQAAMEEMSPSVSRAVLEKYHHYRK